MITNLHESPRKPARVVVLGAGGFIGGASARRLRSDGIEVVALGRESCNLLAADAAARVTEELRPDDVLIFVSAHAPVKNVAMLTENIRMGEAVCAALKNRPVAHVIYISSDAVYKDSGEPISESSCAEPGSLHGVMHLTREVMLRSEFSGPLAFVRPTLTYGINDPHNGYGPNRFRRLAAEGEDLVLFGEGEEQRDHVAVDDIAELVRCIVLHRSTGIANAVSGEVVSFRTLAEFVAAQFTPTVAIKGSRRSGPMPHNGLRPFVPSAALTAFPGFSFTPWRRGIAAMCAETSQAKER
ncbi:MAG: NAD-dependent epimerase/dehydratase family protein [Candidatus Udaeobacter sp.]